MAKASRTRDTKKAKKKGSKRSPKKLLTPLFEPSFWKKHWREAAILFVTGFALYIVGIDYEYVLDDQIVITKNEFTKQGFSGVDDILTTESFTGYFGQQKNILAGARYRPLSIITFAIEHEFFGLNRKVSHLGNIILYALLGLLIFRVLSLIFPNKEGSPWFFGLAFIAALLYITHPVHSEVVANIKGRDELMAMMGSVGAMYAALHYVRYERKIWLFFLGIIMLLALLAKENALTFLAVIPVTMYFFTDAKSKQYMHVLAPIMGAIVVYFIMRYQAIGFLFSSPHVSDDLMNNPFVDMNSGEKLATIFYTLGEYIRLMIFPHPLTHDYYPYHVPIMSWGDIKSILSFLLYAGLAVVALTGLKKKTVFSFSILFYLLTLSIVSNLFVTVGTFMNERFIFISSLGFCIALAYFCKYYLPEIWKNQHAKTVGIALAAIFIVGFTFRTITRVPVWKNPLTLNGAAINVSEKSARSNCFFASALYKEAREQTDQTEKARILEEAYFFIKRAVEIYPAYGSGNQMYAGILGEKYLIDQDLDALLNAYRGIYDHRYSVKYVNDFTDMLLKRNTNRSKMINYIYDVAYSKMSVRHGRPSFGLAYMKKAYEKYPQNAKVNLGMGKIYEALGNSAEAQQFLNSAYSKNPKLRNI